MPISAIYDQLRRIVEQEFTDIIVYAAVETLPTGDARKLRLHVIDGSFVDIFVSITARYSYHWQRTETAGNAFYRHDNAPHASWRTVSTFPKHFHDGSELNVVASHLSSDPLKAIREFCTFVRQVLHATG